MRSSAAKFMLSASKAEIRLTQEESARALAMSPQRAKADQS
jgi:hypothetical protein